MSTAVLTATTIVVRHAYAGDPIPLAPNERIINVVHSSHQPVWDRDNLDVFIEVTDER